MWCFSNIFSMKLILYLLQLPGKQNEPWGQALKDCKLRFNEGGQEMRFLLFYHSPKPDLLE